eukprot:4252316-Pleurochrysis_carterae.AAC.2
MRVGGGTNGRGNDATTDARGRARAGECDDVCTRARARASARARRHARAGVGAGRGARICVRAHCARARNRAPREVSTRVIARKGRPAAEHAQGHAGGSPYTRARWGLRLGLRALLG